MNKQQATEFVKCLNEDPSQFRFKECLEKVGIKGIVGLPSQGGSIVWVFPWGFIVETPEHEFSIVDSGKWMDNVYVKYYKENGRGPGRHRKVLKGSKKKRKPRKDFKL